MIDELAAGMDSVVFRTANIEDDRWRSVLEEAAQLARWRTREVRTPTCVTLR